MMKTVIRGNLVVIICFVSASACDDRPGMLTWASQMSRGVATSTLTDEAKLKSATHNSDSSFGER
ncbi:Uncharacterized protein APZ42_025740 [Daphnia magna]|uniref:Uncharacterized protein n=1 Tax=Daphnia magna TaxID=35525 RepID=A0A164SSS0_9CRUS|nr:Uncharacterized protein APZ42_025740 [Daphnia magna]